MALHLGLNGATRTERLKFTLKLDHKQVEDWIDDVRTVDPKAPKVHEGDTLNLSYEVCCQYFGDVEQRLAALSRLLDVPGIVRQVNLDELNHGHCLFAGIVKRIEDLQRKLGSKVLEDYDHHNEALQL